jgi:excisionase family DNA binding protein
MQHADIAEAFLNTTQVAHLFGTTETAVRLWVFRKRIPYFKINGRIRFKQSELLEWAESHRKLSTEKGGARQSDRRILPAD